MLPIAITHRRTRLADHLGHLATSGVTDFVAIPFGDPDERAQTIEALLSP